MFSNNLLMAAASASGGDAYSVGNSCRFNDDDSAYMSLTGGDAGTDARKVVFFAAVKRGSLGSTQYIFDGDNGSGQDEFKLNFTSSDTLNVKFETTGNGAKSQTTTQVFRDVGSWYFFTFAVDTTPATPTFQLWNWGTEITAFSGTDTLTQNGESAIGNASARIQYGRFPHSANNYLDGYLAMSGCMIGQSFTDPETDSLIEQDDEGEWRSLDVSGLTYGDEGWLLDFSVAPGTDNGAGTDGSGNDNNFSSSGLAAADQVTDTPTNNFCTWSAQGVASNSNAGVTLSNGNLEWDTTANGGWWNSIGTQAVTSGKWYYEQTIDALGAYRSNCCGWSPTSESNSTRPGTSANSFCLLDTDGSYRNNDSDTAYIGSAFVATEVMCCAVDFDNGKIWWRKDGDAWPNSGNPATGANPAVDFTPSGWYSPVTSTGDSGADQTVNFGQTSPNAGGNADDNGYGDFDNAPPSGFLALCTANMTALDFDPANHHQVELVNHDGTSTSFTLGWNADTYDTLFMIKNRDNTENWFNVDGLNGYDKYYENNYTTQFDDSNVISVSGTTITLGSTLPADNYIIECHRAGAAGGASNTDGTITTQVSANTVTQFSILTFTGTGANATVGHGLSGVSFLISYADAAESKGVGHVGANWTHNFYINTTAFPVDDALAFQDTAPSSTVITYGSHMSFNKSSTAMTTYCWDAVPGYSAFGRYTGNGVTDGPVVNVGIKPVFHFLKGIDNSNVAKSKWIVTDAERNPGNPANIHSQFEAPGYGEGSGGEDKDFLSDGVKIRSEKETSNESGKLYIYGMWGIPSGPNKSETPAKAR
jgi:hypothetical protein